MSYRRKHIGPKIKKFKLKRRLITRPLFWILLLSFLALMTMVYFLIFSPEFEVSNVHITGNEKIKTSDIESIVWKEVNKQFLNIVSPKSILLANTSSIIGTIMKEYPLVKEVSVTKKIPKVKIAIAQLTPEPVQPVEVKQKTEPVKKNILSNLFSSLLLLFRWSFR